MELVTNVVGDGPKRALLVHGLSSNGAGWWRVAPAIADLGYTVSMPDLRGHGGSGHADSYTIAEYAADVAALGTDWDLVLGHSLGGSTVLHIGADDTGFAKKMILLDPALIIPSSEDALEWITSAYDGPLTAEAVTAGSPTWHPEDARIKAEALTQSSRNVAAGTLLDNDPWNMIEAVLRLAIPTLLIGADPAMDAIVPPQLGESIAAQNDAVEFTMIPNASHSIHRDEFEPLMAAITAFLS